MDLFIRIQRNGFGPYNQQNNKFNLGWFDAEKHPTPSKDSKLMESFQKEGYKFKYGYCEHLGNFLFGFSSIEQARSWFFDDSVLIRLSGLGFTVLICDGVVLSGNSQACIQAITMKVKQEISILDYFGISEKV